MPIPPGAQLYASASDRDLYDHYRDLGLSPEIAKQHVELRRSNQNPAPEAPNNPDLGAVAAGRIGAAEGLGGLGGALAGGAGGAALGGLGGPAAPVTVPIGALIGSIVGGMGGASSVKPLTKLLSSAPASDVEQQYSATTEAHPTATGVGELGTGVLGALGVAGASRAFTKHALAQAARKQAEAAVKLIPVQAAKAEADLVASQARGVLVKQQTALAEQRMARVQQQLAEEESRLAHPERPASRAAAHENIQLKPAMMRARIRLLEAQIAKLLGT